MIRELNWKEFVNQSHIRNLPLNEQVRQFNFHLDQVANYRIWQNKGQSKLIQRQESDTFFILQEDLDFLLQEDGTKLIWKL
jgi:hypothetical protein